MKKVLIYVGQGILVLFALAAIGIYVVHSMSIGISH